MNLLLIKVLIKEVNTKIILMLNTKTKGTVKVQLIQDKKINQKGGISYLVVHQDSEKKQWITKDRLTKNADNVNCIARYQKLMDAQVCTIIDNEDKQVSMEKPQIKKMKGNQKKKIVNMKKSQKQKAQANSKSENNSIDSKQKNLTSYEKRFENSQKIKKRTLLLSSKEQLSKKESEHLLQIVFNPSMFLQEKKEVLPSETNHTKQTSKITILKAKINPGGKIEFQTQDESGNTWRKAAAIKLLHPQEVIRFYESKMVWNCQ